MDFWAAIVIIVIFSHLAGVMKEFARGRRKKGDDAILRELRELKDEVRQLRRQNNDVVLSLDGSVQRLDQRLGYLESRTPSLPQSESTIAARS